MERAREKERAGCPHSHMGTATTGPDLRPSSGRMASQREEPSVLNALHAGGSSSQTECTETPRLSPSLILPHYHCLCLPSIVAMTKTFSWTYSPWNALNGKWCQNQITEYADNLTMLSMDVEIFLYIPFLCGESMLIQLQHHQSHQSQVHSYKTVCPVHFHRWCDAEASLGPLIVHLSMRFRTCGVLQRSQTWSRWAESAKSKTVLHAECKWSGLQKCHGGKDTRWKEIKKYDSSKRHIMA